MERDLKLSSFLKKRNRTLKNRKIFFYTPVWMDSKQGFFIYLPYLIRIKMKALFYPKFLSPKMISILCIIFPIIILFFEHDPETRVQIEVACAILACAEIIIIPNKPIRNKRSCVFAGVLFVVSVVLLCLRLLNLLIILSLLMLMIELWCRVYIKFSRPRLLLCKQEMMHSLKSHNELICAQILSLLASSAIAAGDSFFLLGILLTLLIGAYAFLVYSYAYDKSPLIGKSREKEIRLLLQECLAPGDALQMKSLYERIIKLMDESKPYLDESYCLGDLVRDVGTNKTYLSRTINMMSGQNFRKFINSYRVDYAMQLMHKDSKVRIQDLAMEVGFHSVVSFGMAFKLKYGIPPVEYLQKLKAGLE